MCLTVSLMSNTVKVDVREVSFPLSEIHKYTVDDALIGVTHRSSVWTFRLRISPARQ